MIDILCVIDYIKECREKRSRPTLTARLSAQLLKFWPTKFLEQSTLEYKKWGTQNYLSFKVSHWKQSTWNFTLSPVSVSISNATFKKRWHYFFIWYYKGYLIFVLWYYKNYLIFFHTKLTFLLKPEETVKMNFARKSTEKIIHSDMVDTAIRSVISKR